jgi:hypothetical protein
MESQEALCMESYFASVTSEEGPFLLSSLLLAVLANPFDVG